MRAAQTPVLVLAPPLYLGPLGVMRTLGRLGVPVFGIAHPGLSLSGWSRYSAGGFAIGVGGRPVGKPEERVLEEVLAAGRRLGQGTVLMGGSDEWSTFIARHREVLSGPFSFPSVSPELISALAGKDELYRLALAHGLPTPRIVVPTDVGEVDRIADGLTYPVMLKPVLSRPSGQSKSVAAGAAELRAEYLRMDDPGNVMFQEYIPGRDEDVWIFNGYFDKDSRCLAAFTGQKIRQHPAHMGIASLGVNRYNQEVVDITTRFLGAVGYRGVVDIGYRYDRRDGAFKVLDINPRLGGAFRIFVDANGLDVARALYWDLTGQPVPQAVQVDGRRWVQEAADLVAMSHYRRDDGLTLRGWLQSYRGVREGATFSASDPLPFVALMLNMVQETAGGRLAKRRAAATGEGAEVRARAA